MMRRSLGPAQSPVVAATIRKREREAQAVAAGRWGLFSFLAAGGLATDAYFGVLRRVFGVTLPVVLYAELLLMVILLVGALYDFVVYMSATVSWKKIQITPAQKKLLRVQKDVGFVTVAQPSPFGSQVPPTPPLPPSTRSPLTFLTPPGSGHSSVHSTPRSTSFLNGQTPTPVSQRGLRSSAHKASPFSEDRITNWHSLESYLKTEEDKEQWLLRGSPDLTSSPSPGYWYGRQPGDYSSPLRKYHVSTRSHSPDGDSPLCREADTLWTRLGIKGEDLDQWTENCRKWIAQTVLGPVAKEIRSINDTLCKIGSPELQVGALSLGALRQGAQSKVQQVPTLPQVLPYLELSYKQEYLVQRITELAQGSYISAYRWKSGGSWKGRTWDQDLPNDSQIVIHLLCTYLDQHMPADPRFPDVRRPFSSQYFLKAPDKPAAKKANICIYQASSNPPQYKVLLKDSCIDVPKGRNNLFHAIVLFLHYIKTEEKSMLGQINVELSGMNILWIIGN